ncbi:hypothetical protein GCM10009060_29010 [Halorubrum trapanicum]
MHDWLTGSVSDDWSPEVLPNELVEDEARERKDSRTDEDGRSK